MDNALMKTSATWYVVATHTPPRLLHLAACGHLDMGQPMRPPVGAERNLPYCQTCDALVRRGMNP